MNQFIKKHFFVIVIVLAFAGSISAAVIPGARTVFRTKVVGFDAGATGAVLSAVTDTGVQQTVTSTTSLPRTARITATSGGTAADIKAIQVVLTGIDHNGTSITETLPVFTENSATTVTGNKVFQQLSQVVIPAHDDTGATTSISYAGAPSVADTDAIMLVLQDTGVQQTVTAGTSLNGMDVARGISATVSNIAGGSNANIGAIGITITGKNSLGSIVSEILADTTANSTNTVNSVRAYNEITQVVIPAQDGTDTQTSIGWNEALGIGAWLKRETVGDIWRDDTLVDVGTNSASIQTSETDFGSNTMTTGSVNDGTPVIFTYAETPE